MFSMLFTQFYNDKKDKRYNYSIDLSSYNSRKSID